MMRQSAICPPPLHREIEIGKAAVGQCPLCPLKQTFFSALSMSALCHKRTFTPLKTEQSSHVLPPNPQPLCAYARHAIALFWAWPQSRAV